MNIDKSQSYSDVLQVGNVLTVTPGASASALVTIEGSKYPVTSATSFGPYLSDVKFSVDVTAGVVSVVELAAEANQLVSASPGSSVFVKNIWCGTQAQYDAIAVKDVNTQYNIVAA